MTRARHLFHEVKWTPEAVRRFWDYHGAHAAAEDASFSRRFGARIIRLGLRGARVLRPGGRFVLTTPHEEDLGAHKVACPECGAVFHRVQHLESVDAASLRALLGRHGLRVRQLRATNFRHFPDRPFWGRLVARVMRLLSRLEARTAPHLVAVAERPR